jgi:tyrosine-protein kinase
MSTYDTTMDAGLVPASAIDSTPRQALPLAAIEQYRALARRLDVDRHAGGPRSLVVTSPTTAEGRTTTALYTAIALAGRGHRVVLADFDLRRPELAARHDLPELPGLVEVIRGEASLDQALKLAPGAPGLTLLPAGTAQVDPSPILFDPRTKQMIEALTGAFDFVLCDAPPVLGVADAACLADLIGGALLVARAGRTSRRELAAAAAALRGVKIVGCVLTGVETFASFESRRAEQVVARKQISTALVTRGG